MQWAPIWMKLGATSALQHVGGIHSGCALSGSAWLVYKVIDIFSKASLQHITVLITGVTTCVFVLVSALSAVPWVRNTHHNVFERNHRFIGWLGIAVSFLLPSSLIPCANIIINSPPGCLSFWETFTTSHTASGGRMPMRLSAFRSSGLRCS